MRLLAFSAALLVLAAVPAAMATPQECAQFAVDSCENIDDSSLATIVTADPAECRSTCELVFDDCTMFIFTNSTDVEQNCELFKYDIDNYLEHCKFLGGPRDLPPAEDCLDTGDFCDAYRSSDCVVEGAEIESIEMDKVEDCQLLCDSDPDCEYFTYETEDKVCTTFADAVADCAAYIGPREPALENC